MYTDRSFHYPLYKAVESYIKYANTTKNPVYLYKFAYKGSLSYSRVFTGTDRDFGVGHIDDLIYLFKTPALFREFATGSDAAQLIRALVSTYVQFAKHGYVKYFLINLFFFCTIRTKMKMFHKYLFQSTGALE